MRTPFALAAALVLLAAATPAVADGCQLVRAASLDMSFDLAGGVQVPMTIQGQSFDMLIDTGGIYSMLTEETVKKLDLMRIAIPLEGFDMRMYGGKRVSHFAVAHDIVFGGLKAPRLNAMILPDGFVPEGTGGIVGPDILRAYDDDFDFANGKFSLFLSKQCEGSPVYWTTEPHAEVPITIDEVGHIVVPISIDGKEVRAVLDTGSSRSIMSLERAQLLFGIADNDARLVKDDATHLGAPFRFPFKTVTMQDIAVSDPDILLVPDDDSQMFANGPPVILGMGILRQLHIYIAYRQHKIYATAASAH